MMGVPVGRLFGCRGYCNALGVGGVEGAMSHLARAGADPPKFAARRSGRREMTHYPKALIESRGAKRHRPTVSGMCGEPFTPPRSTTRYPGPGCIKKVLTPIFRIVRIILEDRADPLPDIARHIRRTHPRIARRAIATCLYRMANTVRATYMNIRDARSADRGSVGMGAGGDVQAPIPP